MNQQEFATAVSLTMNSTATDEMQLNNYALGLVCEASDIVKKVAHHGHVMDEETLLEVMMEIGDILWYIYALAEKLGFSVDDCQTHVVNKLRKRYPSGFNTKASINRKDNQSERDE